MRVAFYDFRRTYRRYRREIERSTQRVFRRGRFILGPEVEAFERAFGAFLGAKHVVGVNSGTDAIALALRSLDVGTGDEVITVSNTFTATVSAIRMVGATPVFADIDPVTMTMDAGRAAALVTRKTKAIVPVHLYGYPADMGAIMKVARRYGLKVVEDACQAHGATYRNRAVGTIGNAGAFSFYPTKDLGAFGDGGAVVVRSPSVAKKVRAMRQYGETERYVSTFEGMNSRLDELQAAYLRWGLRHLERWDEQRAKLAARYTEGLEGLPLSLPLPGDRTYGRRWYLYVVATPLRDRLKRYLAERGVQTLVHYPVPIHAQPAYRFLKVGDRGLAVSVRAARQVLSLPLYPEMTVREADYVVRTIQRFFTSAR